MKTFFLVLSLLFVTPANAGFLFLTPIKSGATPFPPYTNTHSAVFNGVTSKQAAANNAAINFTKTDSFSGGAWVRTVSMLNQGVLSKLSVGSQGYYLQLSQAANPPRVRFFLIDAGVNATYSTSTTQINSNTWYHIGWSYNGNGLASGIKIYVNGVLETPSATNNGISSNINGAGDLVIGSNGDGFTQPFNGKIDEPFIVAGVLTGANFATIYGAGQATSLTPFNPLVWLQENNNNTDFGSLGLTFTDTAMSYSTDIP